MRNHLAVKRLLLRSGWLIILVLAAGCFGSTRNSNTPSALLSGNVELRCSDGCAARGQCGAGVDGVDRVFINSSSPAVDNHDQAFTTGTPGVIQSVVTPTLQIVATGEQIQRPFYLVSVGNGITQGYVAPWCVVQP